MKYSVIIDCDHWTPKNQAHNEIREFLRKHQNPILDGADQVTKHLAAIYIGIDQINKRHPRTKPHTMEYPYYWTKVNGAQDRVNSVCGKEYEFINVRGIAKLKVIQLQDPAYPLAIK